MDDGNKQKALAEVVALTARLVERPGSTIDDAMVVASTLVMVAEMIVVELKGPKVAATLFLNLAEQLCAETH